MHIVKTRLQESLIVVSAHALSEFGDNALKYKKSGQTGWLAALSLNAVQARS